MRGKNLKIIKQILNYFGKDAQIDKLQEECMELSLELHQLKCPTKQKERKRRLEKVYGELADVKIMMRQAEMIFDKRKINKIVSQKLKAKQEKYLSNGK